MDESLILAQIQNAESWGDLSRFDFWPIHPLEVLL